MKTSRVSDGSAAAGEDGHRQRILAYADERFMAEGFASVPVEEICRDLGMSKKTFYRSFGSKEALVGAMMDRVMGQIAGEMERIVDVQEPLAVRVHRMMLFLAMNVGRLGKPLLRDIQRHTPEIWERVQRFRRERVFTSAARILEEGKQEGSLRQDVDMRLLLLAYIGAIEAVMVPGVLTRESFSGEEAVRGILTVFFLGVLTGESADHLRSLLQPTT